MVIKEKKKKNKTLAGTSRCGDKQNLHRIVITDTH